MKMSEFPSLDSLNLSEYDLDTEIKIKKTPQKDIAIVGVAGKIANSHNVQEFWEQLSIGMDMVSPIPENRKKDSDGIYKSQNSALLPEYLESGYMTEIDKFDYKLFSISPKEASLMDPNQRLFLQTAYSAIEDAAYGGGKLKGSSTGVFIGYSGDFEEGYNRYVKRVAPDSTELSVAGNVTSIIASRIAYMLDLKGPSMVIDTACSSALVATHIACRSLRNGDCSMAIAGSVKLELLPVKGSESAGIGIESSDDRAKTFDDSSDGTGIGEGVVALILKPLQRAVEDKDNIYAVIKGSAINQDGRSNGITAPNSSAQEDVILRAWQDADIDPETITYIEAHGTGTELGDPIEISGIQRAFKNYTQRKQFCAIGSVKSNVGHLDHAAGMAGLVKVIFALKNRQIPPTLHFKRPNRRIDFTESPVYVNDCLNDWEVNDSIRRCGISSFGLSGTNCHMILEEAPIKEEVNTEDQLNVLTLSAKNIESLKILVKNYSKFIKNHNKLNLADICYTANTGRGHHEYRMAILLSDISELKDKLNILETLNLEDDLPPGIYYGYHNIVPNSGNIEGLEVISESDKKKISKKANEKLLDCKLVADNKYILEDIIQMYIQGAEVKWENLYKNRQYNKLSLPTYPFEEKRCWIEFDGILKTDSSIHPLLDRCSVETMGMKIFEKNFNVKGEWILEQHKVSGHFILPGTAYIEMVCEVAKNYYHFKEFELKDVIFQVPFIIEEDQPKKIQLLVKEKEDYLKFSILSKDYLDNWIENAEGKICVLDHVQPTKKSIKDIIARYNQINPDDLLVKEMKENTDSEVQVGDRWDVLNKVYVGEGEYLIYFEVPERYQRDLKSYTLYPPLLDQCINITTDVIDGNVFLPFTFKSLKVYDQMSEKVISYWKKRESLENNNETVLSDVLMSDAEGNVVAVLSEYSVKKVSENGLHRLKDKNMFYEINWIAEPLSDTMGEYSDNKTSLIFKNSSPKVEEIIKGLKLDDTDIIEVEVGKEFSKENDFRYTVSFDEADYQRLAEELKDRDISRVIHMFNAFNDLEVKKIDDFDQAQDLGVNSLFYLVRSFINNRYMSRIDFILISDYANQVVAEQTKVKPLNASLFGLAKIIPLEYENLKIKSIDIDTNTEISMIINEIVEDNIDNQLIAYRNNKRYVEELARVDLEQVEHRDLKIKSEGTYLITGGMGGIGLEIGKYLASKNKINLILVNRTSLPAKEEWDKVLKEETDKKLLKKLKGIREIESLGTKVFCYSADVSDLQQMQKLILSLRDQFGKLDGVVHGAGVAGDGFIIHKDIKKFRTVIDTKTKGTWILDELTRVDNPDFFMVFSSLASMLAEPGQGDYTAANCYLDSFVYTKSDSPTVKIAIDWPAWKETGMAFDYGLEEGIFVSLSTKLALESFEKVLEKKVTRVIIGEIDYNLLNLKRNSLKAKLAQEVEKELKISIRKSRPNNKHKDNNTIDSVKILGKNHQQLGEVEIKLANIWANLLGFDEINVFEVFSAMGGDSIMATRLLKEVEKEFPNVINIADIFTYPTISQMAAYIEKKAIKKEPVKTVASDNLSNILDKLAKGEIAVADADIMLNIKEGQ